MTYKTDNVKSGFYCIQISSISYEQTNFEYPRFLICCCITFQNQSIILDGTDGVMISVDKLPFAAETQDSAPRWYKLCVCMPSGRVFRIPVREHGYGCQDVRFPESINPCS